MTNKLTPEEFRTKYANVVVKFSSYYKFSFTYKAVLDNGNTLTVSCGGNADDIYRLEVVNDEEVTVSKLSPYVGDVFDKITGSVIETFYDY